MFIKGIKKGKTIELLEELNLPDEQELLLEIRQVNDFWSALEDFRENVDLSGMDSLNDDNLRDRSTGRDVNL
jgi:hypothetical protein